MDLLFWIIIVILFINYGDAYPGGAPDSACGAMFPSGHSARPQTTKAPYRIVLPKKSYAPGETIKVLITSDKDHHFKGVFLQSRSIGCQNNGSGVIGVFTTNDNELETKHCFGIIHSAVSHNSNSVKRSKYVYWTAPVHPAGHVIMRATIVEDTTTFWINIVSDILVDLHSRDTPTCIQSTVFPIHPAKGVAYSDVNNKTYIHRFPFNVYVIIVLTWVSSNLLV